MTDIDADFSVELIDELEESERGAEQKFKIVGVVDQDGRQAGSVLVDADIGKRSHIVQAQLAHICHGTMSPSGVPATLLVMLFAFQPRGHNKRFKSVEITMTFSGDANVGVGGVKPEVYGISPLHEWSIFPSEKTEEVSHSINPTIQGSVGPVTGSVGYQWQFKQTQKSEDRAIVFGLMRPSRTTNSTNDTAFWGLYENESTKSGIPTLFQAAVLVKRQPPPSQAGEAGQRLTLGQSFSSTLEIVGEVDRLVEVGETLKSVTKKMFGRRRKGQDLMFDPKQQENNIASPATAGQMAQNPNNLYAEDLDRFRKLVTVQMWADGTAVESKTEKPQDSTGQPIENTATSGSDPINQKQNQAEPAADREKQPLAGKDPPRQEATQSASTVRQDDDQSPRAMDKGTITTPTVLSSSSPANVADINRGTAVATGTGPGSDNGSPITRVFVPAITTSPVVATKALTGVTPHDSSNPIELSQPPPSQRQMAYNNTEALPATMVEERPSSSSPSGTATSSERLKLLRQEMAEVKAQRLDELRRELAKVRIEANLIRRLMNLEREEASIMQEIIQLESPNTGPLK